MKCKICSNEFKNKVALSAHMSGKHKIFSKEYYDKFIKKDDDNEGNRRIVV